MIRKHENTKTRKHENTKTRKHENKKWLENTKTDTKTRKLYSFLSYGNRGGYRGGQEIVGKQDAEVATT